MCICVCSCGIQMSKLSMSLHYNISFNFMTIATSTLHILSLRDHPSQCLLLKLWFYKGIFREKTLRVWFFIQTKKHQIHQQQQPSSAPNLGKEFIISSVSESYAAKWGHTTAWGISSSVSSLNHKPFRPPIFNLLFDFFAGYFLFVF